MKILDNAKDYYGAYFSPSWHAGLRSGRYYSAPYASVAATAVAADTIYWSVVEIPEAATIVELGFTVTTTGTATLANVGLYKVAAGNLTAMSLPSAISVSSTGDKTATISTPVTPGMYMIGIVFNGTSTINTQTVTGPGGAAAFLSAVHGNSTSSESATAVLRGLSTAYPYAALPGATYALSNAVYGNTLLPHLWYRV